MDVATLLAVTDFARARTLSILDTIEKAEPETAKVLAWRPGPGRAHIAWQAMHCAATHDRYVHLRIQGDENYLDPELVKNFGGGSTPSDTDVPALTTIRQKLAATLNVYRGVLSHMTPEQLASKTAAGDRTIGEAVTLLAWHEAHHQGQMHITWNMYKAAHGIG